MDKKKSMTEKDHNKVPYRVFLVDDQEIVAKTLEKMFSDNSDIELQYCSDPSEAIDIASNYHPTVILQDLIMPDVDGLSLVRYFRANEATRNVPLIVLSSKEEDSVKAEAFALGANDYMVKLPGKEEVIARVCYHSKGYTNLLEKNKAFKELEESQMKLKQELAEAAEYVRSLLPEPSDDRISTSWTFIPSTDLGGDAFGYHWIDDENFALYLLDVCGHGVGAALLSISVVNVLRSQSLQNTNFLEPIQVLNALNQAFPMEKNNQMFFTIWYGVFHQPSGKLTFSNGGHPPAILFSGDSQDDFEMIKLTTDGVLVGGIPDAKFYQDSVTVKKFNRFFVFSDGVYEIEKADETRLYLDDFIHILEKTISERTDSIDLIVQAVEEANSGNTFEDDFSILQVIFKPG